MPRFSDVFKIARVWVQGSGATHQYPGYPRYQGVAHGRCGAWEGDLLVGHANASALGTLVERTTRFRLLVTLKPRTRATVRHAFARELRTLLSQLRRSLT